MILTHFSPFYSNSPINKLLFFEFESLPYSQLDITDTDLDQEITQRIYPGWDRLCIVWSDTTVLPLMFAMYYCEFKMQIQKSVFDESAT